MSPTIAAPISGSRRWLLWLLLGFGGIVVFMVVVFYIKRARSLSEAQSRLMQQRPPGQTTEKDGTPAPSVPPPASTGSTAPLPTHIETLCWMTNEIAKNGGKGDWRCEVCNNAATIGEADVRLWANTYSAWYQKNLVDDLGSANFKDCGCVPFFCGCSTPDFERVKQILAA